MKEGKIEKFNLGAFHKITHPLPPFFANLTGKITANIQCLSGFFYSQQWDQT